MQQMVRPGGFSIIFRLLGYLPYVAIGLLVIAIALWVVFGIKKLRWTKILAIILTVLVVITGVSSLGTLFLGRSGGGFPSNGSPPNGEQFQEFEDRGDSGVEESAYSNIINNMEVVI